MASKTPAVVRKELELRRKALADNVAELPQMEVTLQKVDAVLTEMKDLTAKQASLTADKQEVTKRLVALNLEAQRLLAFVDAGIRAHYGTRSERLVEFGQQPYRSQPRIKLIGLDGQPVVKRKKPTAAAPEPTPAPAEPPVRPPDQQ